MADLLELPPRQALVTLVAQKFLPILSRMRTLQELCSLPETQLRLVYSPRAERAELSGRARVQASVVIGEPTSRHYRLALQIAREHLGACSNVSRSRHC